MNLSVVILAAGQGTRMRSKLPKVLHAIGGRPMLTHVVDTARVLKPSAVHIVYGHGGMQVRTALQDLPVRGAEQTQQLGTGHAAASKRCKVSTRVNGTSPYNTSTTSSSTMLGSACATAWPVPSCCVCSTHRTGKSCSAARTCMPPWPYTM